MQSPTGKATLAVSVFALAAALSLSFSTTDVRTSLPLIGYDAVLLLNTFFSIRTFAAITPSNALQIAFDGVLAVIFIALAFSFNSTIQFAFVSGLLFVIAVGKYSHLNRIIIMPKLLRRKIVLNGLAAFLSFSVAVIALYGYSTLAAWILCGAFVIANVYVLLINPMYRLDS